MSAPELIPVPAVWSGNRRGGSGGFGAAEARRCAARPWGWNFIEDFHMKCNPFGIVVGRTQSWVLEFE